MWPYFGNIDRNVIGTVKLCVIPKLLTVGMACRGLRLVQLLAAVPLRSNLNFFSA
jgi:hypothetical protein